MSPLAVGPLWQVTAVVTLPKPRHMRTTSGGVPCIRVVQEESEVVSRIHAESAGQAQERVQAAVLRVIPNALMVECSTVAYELPKWVGSKKPRGGKRK